jgi:hypothetical protein
LISRSSCAFRGVVLGLDLDGLPKMNRRQVLGGGAAALFVPGVGMAAPGFSADASELRVPVLESPDLVVAFVGDVEAQRVRLERDGARWRGGSGAAGVEVGVRAGDQESVVTIAAAGAVQRVHLRWKRPFSEGCRVLGDAWSEAMGIWSGCRCGRSVRCRGMRW